jgi:acetoacetyl-CoA synthetase
MSKTQWLRRSQKVEAKGIVHGVGGTLIQHAKEHRLHGDVREGDVVFYYTTCGWMMWNWLISTLQIGATAVLYEGSPFHPSPLALWELAARENVTHFGTSAKYLNSCRQAGIQPRELGLNALRVIFSTGSPLHAPEFDWVYQSVKKTVLLSSISGGTDIISCFLLGNPILPVFRGEIQCLGLGMDVGCEDENGLTGTGRAGELICRNPFPSMPLGFWNDPGGLRYRESYFKNGGSIWYHGDQILITGSQGQKGGIVVLGRSDTTLNPGGVRIGTAEIYRAVEGMTSVEDCLAVGVMFDDEEKVALFVRLAADVEWNEDLKNQIRKKIRHEATPRHVPEVIFPVDAIPYTRNGKKMELALRDLFRGREPENLNSMANPECLDQYRRLREAVITGI